MTIAVRVRSLVFEDWDAVGIDKQGQLLERLAVQGESFNLDVSAIGSDRRGIADVVVPVEPAPGPDAVENAPKLLLMRVRLLLTQIRE
jgi:hypothetical protein